MVCDRAGEEAERLARDTDQRTERPVQLVAVAQMQEVMPAPGQARPLAQLVTDTRANLLVLDREAQQSEEDRHPGGGPSLERNARSAPSRSFTTSRLGKLPIWNRTDLTSFRHQRDPQTSLREGQAVFRPRDRVGGNGRPGSRHPACRFGGSVWQSWSSVLQPAPSRQGRRRVHDLQVPHHASGNGSSTWTAVDDPRLGSIGRMLRRLHIDELPQMWNVLRHDLSIVGPRPEQPHYVELLSKSIPFYDVRHLVRPGITGWAQINYDYGSSDIDALEKLQYEFFYLRHQSLRWTCRSLAEPCELCSKIKHAEKEMTYPASDQNPSEAVSESSKFNGRLRPRVSYNASTRLIGCVAGAILSLVVLRLVTHDFGPVRWGEVVAASAFANLFVSVCDFGLTRIVSREMATPNADGPAIYGGGLLAGLLVSCMAMAT